MDPAVLNLFKKDDIVKMHGKLDKMFLNTGSNSKKPFTLFEMIPYKNEAGIKHDLFSVFDIFVSEDEFYKLQEGFIHLNKKVVNKTVFGYKNMTLTKEDCSGEKFICERILDEDYIIADKVLNVLSEIKLEDPSQFSCRDDIKKRDLLETRYKVAENVGIYVSFIHDKLINKLFYKLWFKIEDDIDDVLDAFIQVQQAVLA